MFVGWGRPSLRCVRMTHRRMGGGGARVGTRVGLGLMAVVLGIMFAGAGEASAAMFGFRSVFFDQIEGPMHHEGFEDEFLAGQSVLFHGGKPPGMLVTKSGGGPTPVAVTYNSRRVSEGLRALSVLDAPAFDNQSLTFQFERPMRFFGIDVNDFGTFGTGALTVEVPGVIAVTELASVTAFPLPLGNKIFFGVVSETPFQTVRFKWTTAGDGVGFDNAIISIPEPATVMLALVGLVLMATTRRHRRLA